MSNENQKVSQADRLMERWAGRRANKSKIAGTKPTVSGYVARMRLAKREPFKSNPEYAFGCARLLMTYNIMSHEDFNWFLYNHPAWKQIMEKGTIEVNGKLMYEANESLWGGSHNVTATLEVSGTAEVTYEGRRGVKTENVKLAFEMIRYEGDTRPFIALNLGGGSAIRHFLLGTEGRPDFTVNDDSNTRRYVSRRSSEKVKAQERAELEKQLDKQADDLVSRLLAGESVAIGAIAHESKQEPSERDNRNSRKAPAAFRKEVRD